MSKSHCFLPELSLYCQSIWISADLDQNIIIYNFF